MTQTKKVIEQAARDAAEARREASNLAGRLTPRIGKRVFDPDVTASGDVTIPLLPRGRSRLGPGIVARRGGRPLVIRRAGSMASGEGT